MYIHQLVIDANCINAKGNMAEMNELEAFHAAGAIEIIKTSTLSVEFSIPARPARIQAEKAKNYRTIGGYLCYIPGDDRAQSIEGACVRPSLVNELFFGVFEQNLTGEALQRALRDCLHIDQAQMNGVDFFVTNDQALSKAEIVLRRHGVTLRILQPAECLDFIRKYFQNKIGTDEPTKLAAYLTSHGPIVLGSNSCYGATIIAGPAEEELLRLQIVDRKVVVHACFRDLYGLEALRIAPGQRVAIAAPKATLETFGDGPILVGESAVLSLVVKDNGRALVAIRTTQTSRVVVYALSLRDVTGREVAKVEGSELLLSGGGLKTH